MKVEITKRVVKFDLYSYFLYKHFVCGEKPDLQSLWKCKYLLEFVDLRKDFSSLKTTILIPFF